MLSFSNWGHPVFLSSLKDLSWWFSATWESSLMWGPEDVMLLGPWNVKESSSHPGSVHGLAILNCWLNYGWQYVRHICLNYLSAPTLFFLIINVTGPSRVIGRVLVTLHVAGQGSVPGTLYSLPSLPKVIPKLKAMNSIRHGSKQNKLKKEKKEVVDISIATIYVAHLSCTS